MDVQTLTQDRFAKHQERIAEQAGYGSTDAGLAVVSKYHKDTVEILKSKKKRPREITNLDCELLALLCLQVGLSSVANEDSLSKTMYALGMAAEREVVAHKLVDRANGSPEAKAEIQRITKSIMRRHSSVKYRKAAMRSAAQQAGLGARSWKAAQWARVGAWLLSVCLETSVFVRVTEPAEYISLTEEACDYAGKIVDHLLLQRPAMLPLLEPPAPWAHMQSIISGYRHQLVRTHDKVSQAIIRREVQGGMMSPVLGAVNGAQSVAYRINLPVLAMVRWAHEHDIAIEGLPRKSLFATPEPSSPFEELSNTERRVWRKRAFDVHKANRSNFSETIQLTQDLKIAEFVGPRPFWVPMNIDYRGRIYGIPHFNFQRQDHIRALFMFDEGKPLDADGLYWLKVHLANCGDFEKVSKKSFEERVAWVHTNIGQILRIGFDPKGDLWWTKADKPFMFLAACIALAAWHEDDQSLCHLPVSFDGTCSGLQHLAAMTKDEDTARLVNLSATDAPNDVYQAVASRAQEAMYEDIGGEHSLLAMKALEYGVGRSLVKRNVMTYSYSSNRVGMARQHMEDTMSPLSFKVMCGELAQHPFEIPEDTTDLGNGVVGCCPGYHASRYLADRIYRTIEETIKRPADAMRFLQGLARAAAHEEKPLVWRTRLGMPVVLRYPVYSDHRLLLWLHDRGIKSKLVIHAQEETKRINKTKAAAAVAPSFVHSMDACHLMQVIRHANDEGINSIALVHDSFGCLPTDASRFRTIIKEAFHWLYSRDVLAQVRQEALDQTDNKSRIPSLPDYGTYNIDEIRDAEYAFA